MGGHEGTSLDSSQVLQSFRRISGSDNGVKCSELHELLNNVRNEQLRVPLQRSLPELFDKYGREKTGSVDILEFEQMLKGSTMLESAMYELLELGSSPIRVSRVSSRSVPCCSEFRLTHLCGCRVVSWIMGAQLASVSLVLLDAISMAIAVDAGPGAKGWRVLELCLACLFTGDILLRLMLDSRKCKQVAFNLLDVVILAVTWIDIGLMGIDVFSNGTSPWARFFRWTRFLRFFRFSRIIRNAAFFSGLWDFLHGLVSSIRTVLWGFMVIIMVVFLWAMLIRHMIVYDWFADESGIIQETFPSVARGSFVLLRCLALSVDGACTDPQHHENIFDLLASQFGSWFFDAAWVATEFLIQLGILNAVIAMFVTQAVDNQSEFKEIIRAECDDDNQERLQKLDRLLRTLIHPTRKAVSNPKDRHATEVATMIRLDYPEVAENIPDLEVQLVSFSESILDAKRIHQKAMDEHAAAEVNEVKKLHKTPNAKLYLVNGQEVLLSDDASISDNALGLGEAPVDAVPVLLTQDHDDLKALFEEAEEVQSYVKSLVLPGSNWAARDAAGNSGPSWRQSGKLCDEAVDPGPKSPDRALQKVRTKYDGRWQRNRDYSRLCFAYDTVGHLLEAIPRLLAFTLAEASATNELPLASKSSNESSSGGMSQGHVLSSMSRRMSFGHSSTLAPNAFDSRKANFGFQVVRLENRFAHPHPLGWRDITALLRVRVPSTGKYHIMELQMVLRSLKDARGEAHTIYEEIRQHLPDDLVMKVIDRLVTDTTLDLGINKAEWEQCIKNREVKRLLDDLGIPRKGRRHVFDVLDIDASGKVTSSELRGLLEIYKTRIQTPDIVSCHLRVREIQQQLHDRMEPRLVKMHDLAADSYGAMLKSLRLSQFEKSVGKMRLSSDDLLPMQRVESTAVTEQSRQSQNSPRNNPRMTPSRVSFFGDHQCSRGTASRNSLESFFCSDVIAVAQLTQARRQSRRSMASIKSNSEPVSPRSPLRTVADEPEEERQISFSRTDSVVETQSIDQTQSAAEELQDSLVGEGNAISYVLSV